MVPNPNKQEYGIDNPAAIQKQISEQHSPTITRRHVDVDSSITKKKENIGRRITNKINGFLENSFESLGITVANNPWKTIGFSLLCACLCTIGIMEYTVENRGEKIWVSQSSLSLKHKDWVDENFVVTFRQISVMVQNKNGDILNREGLLALLDIHERVENIGKGTDLSLEKLCFKTGNQCVPRSILELWHYNRTLIQNLTSTDIKNKINEEPLRSPMTGKFINTEFIVGGPVQRSNDNKIVSASVLRTNYRINKNLVFDEGKGELVDEKGEKYEEMFDEEMAKEMDYYNLYSHSVWAADDAAANAANDDLQFFVVGYILVIIYLATMLGSFSRLNHKVYLAFGGISVIGIAIGISYGLGSAFQLKKSGVHDVLPFLLLGIGVDDVFVIIQNWDNVGGPVNDGRSIPEKVSQALKHAGVSILVTSVTDVCAFFIGATTILPGLRSFCIWAGIGILAVFIYTITFFVALLTLDAKRQEARRDACLCCIKLSDNWEPMQCSKKNNLQLFIKNFYAPTLLSTPGKIFALIATAGLLAGGAYGLSSLEQNFDETWFQPEDSRPRQFTDNQKIFFPGNGVRSEVFTGQMDYYKEYIAMNNIVTKLNSDKYVSDGTVDSWYYNFHLWLNTSSHSNDLQQESICSQIVTGCRAKNESLFYQYLNEYLQTDNGQHYQNVIVFGDNKKIKAAAIEFTHTIFNGASEEIDGMDSVQEHIQAGTIQSETKSDLLPFVYTENYIGWETNKVIGEELVRNIVLASVCVFVVTLFLISNFLTSVMVLLCVVFALINLAGYMHYWDLTIDTVTTIIMVLAIGLTVDYSAHLGHAFMVANKGNKNDRMTEALTEIGPAVINGATSTVLAFALLGASKSYVFFAFFKVFLLVVLFGMFHGMIFLPVILSIIGPKPYHKNEETSIEKESKKSDVPAEKNIELKSVNRFDEIRVVVDSHGGTTNDSFKIEY